MVCTDEIAGIAFLCIFVWNEVPTGQKDTYQETENRKLSGRSERRL
jgi:hypothetical protein